ncbi:hypothetical protein ABZX85_47780 [Streptomyces sp. NPDC004539]
MSFRKIAPIAKNHRKNEAPKPVAKKPAAPKKAAPKRRPVAHQG